MRDQFREFLTKKNLSSLLVLAIMILAIPVGIQYLKTQQIIKTKAVGGLVVFASPGIDSTRTMPNGSPVTVAVEQTVGMLIGLPQGWSYTDDSTPPPSGLISEWKLDEGSGTAITDSVGDNDGTFEGGNAIWKSGTNCKSGGCLQIWAPAQDYIKIPDTNLKPSKITVAVWAKSASQDWNQFGWIVSNRTTDNAAGTGYIMHPWGSTKQTTFYVGVGGRLVGAEVRPADIREWHHYVGTFDGSNVKIYLDGNLVKSTPASGDISYSGTSNVLTMGKDDDEDGAISSARNRFGDGFIDEIQIYNRALGDSEVTDLYNSYGTPPPPPGTSSEIMLWRYFRSSGGTNDNWTTSELVQSIDRNSYTQVVEPQGIMFSANTDGGLIPLNDCYDNTYHTASIADCPSGQTKTQLGYIYPESTSNTTGLSPIYSCKNNVYKNDVYTSLDENCIGVGTKLSQLGLVKSFIKQQEPEMLVLNSYFNSNLTDHWATNPQIETITSGYVLEQFLGSNKIFGYVLKNDDGTGLLWPLKSCYIADPPLGPDHFNKTIFGCTTPGNKVIGYIYANYHPETHYLQECYIDAWQDNQLLPGSETITCQSENAGRLSDVMGWIPKVKTDIYLRPNENASQLGHFHILGPATSGCDDAGATITISWSKSEIENKNNYTGYKIFRTYDGGKPEQQELVATGYKPTDQTYTETTASTPNNKNGISSGHTYNYHIVVTNSLGGYYDGGWTGPVVARSCP